MDFFDKLQGEFKSALVWIELGCLLASLLLAYGIAAWAGSRRPVRGDSVLMGKSATDGLLFPLVALALTYFSKSVLAHSQTVYVLRAAVPILMSLAAIRFFARVLTNAFPTVLVLKPAVRFVAVLAWATTVLWILGLLPSMLEEFDSIQLVFGKTVVSLRALAEGSVSSALVLIAALWISSTVERKVLNEAILDLSMRRVAINSMRAVLLLVGLLFALSAVGVDLTALSVLGGALGVGLGFGLQKLAANYVSGFVILLERSLRIGDNVRVDGFEGRITDIKTRYTLLRSPTTGRESIVPNETMVSQRVENLTKSDLMFFIVSNVTVSYESDVDVVQAVLREAALSQPRVLKDPQPTAYLINFAPDGLEFSLYFWISDPANGQNNIRSAVNLAVLAGLRAANINIPFPQRVVQLLPPTQPVTPPAVPFSVERA
jgi:small-conductance mechanosensitive channel